MTLDDTSQQNNAYDKTIYTFPLLTFPLLLTVQVLTDLCNFAVLLFTNNCMTPRRTCFGCNTGYKNTKTAVF